MAKKVCTQCGQEKVLDDYGNDKRVIKDGKRAECKVCSRKRNKEWEEQNRERVRLLKREWDEQNREKVREWGRKNYWKHRDRRLEYAKKYREENEQRLKEQNRENNPKRKEYFKKYREQNRDHIRKRSRKNSDLYRQVPENKEKIRTYNRKRKSLKKRLPSTLTAQQWMDCLEYFNNKCAYCGKEKELHQEHFIPMSKGGIYTINNIIPACVSCNQSKKAMGFYEWYPEQEFYSMQREKKILKYLNIDGGGQQRSILEEVTV